MKMKLAYNIGLYRGHAIDRTIDGYVIFEDDKVVYYTETNIDDAAIRYKAMETGTYPVNGEEYYSLSKKNIKKMLKKNMPKIDKMCPEWKNK